MKLLQSRRFWMLTLDTAIALTLHFVAGPDVNFVITALQPLFIVIITSYTVEDVALIRAGK